MKVAELIEKLQEYDPDTAVHIAFPSGDYWKTILAPTVRSIDESFVKLSNYHDKPALVTDEDVEEKCYEDDQLPVVVLSC